MPDVKEDIDISDLPPEGQHHEYKCSAGLDGKTRSNYTRLGEEITKTASAFWNSGGGLLVIGVKNDGKCDGGISRSYGEKPVEFWIDQVLKKVDPPGRYDLRVFSSDDASVSTIAAGRCVVAIKFHSSNWPPHMACDKHYYVRFGEHSGPATHYIVEALTLKRRFLSPVLSYQIRQKPENANAAQLLIVLLSGSPALHVKVSLAPLPHLLKAVADMFPLRLPHISSDSPFCLDLGLYAHVGQDIGEGLDLDIEYENLQGEVSTKQFRISKNSFAPRRIGIPAIDKVSESLESIEGSMSRIADAASRYAESRVGRTTKEGPSIGEGHLDSP